MVRALNAVSVPTVAVPDLDLLNDEGKVRAMVESFGGDWSAFTGDYRIATAAFRQPRVKMTNAQVLLQVRAVLEVDPTGLYDVGKSEHLRLAIRAEPSPWEQLKRFGDRAFKGEAFQAASRLFERLQSLGIAIVRAGVLENLAPDVVSSKGPGWLTEALAKRSYLDALAQAHIQQVVEAVKAQLRFGALPTGESAP